MSRSVNVRVAFRKPRGLVSKRTSTAATPLPNALPGPIERTLTSGMHCAAPPRHLRGRRGKGTSG
jgi:hypothetical protein